MSGVTPRPSKAKLRPGAPEGGLRLVEDQQHAARVAELAQPREIAVRRNDDAAGAQDGLDDGGGRRADRLRVEQVEAHVETAHVAAVAAMPDRAAIAVRLGNRERARNRRPVAAPAAGVGVRAGARRRAMPRAVETDDLEAAGELLGQTQRRFVALAAGIEKDQLGQASRQQRRHAPRERCDRRRQHAAEQVQHLAAALFDRGDDRRMIVAERGAHLARGKIEDGAPVLVVKVRSAGAYDELGMKFGAVADQVLAHRPVQRGRRFGVGLRAIGIRRPEAACSGYPRRFFHARRRRYFVTSRTV